MLTIKSRDYGEPIHPDAPGFNPQLHKDLVPEINEAMLSLRADQIGPIDALPTQYSFRKAEKGLEFYDVSKQAWAPLASSSGGGGGSTAVLTRTLTGGNYSAPVTDTFSSNPVTAGTVTNILNVAPTYSDGKVILDGPSAQSSFFGYTRFAPMALLDTSVDITIVADNYNYRHAGFFIQGAPGVNGYRIVYLVNANGPTPQVIISRFDNGTETNISAVNANFTWAVGEVRRWRTLINFVTGRIQVWVDGVPINDYTDAPRWTGAGIPGGMVYGCKASFDNLTVVAPATQITGLLTGMGVRLGSTRTEAAADGTAIVAGPGRAVIESSAGSELCAGWVQNGESWAFVGSAPLLPVSLSKVTSGPTNFFYDGYDTPGVIAPTVSSTTGYQYVSQINVINGQASRVAGYSREAKAITNFAYADSTVSARFTFPAGQGDCGLFVRVQPDETSGSLCYFSAARQLQWYRVNSQGSYTLMGTYGSGVPEGVHDLKIVSVGSQHSIYLDGTLITTVTDGLFTSGRSGIFMSGPNASAFPTVDEFLLGTVNPVSVTGLPAGARLYSSRGPLQLYKPDLVSVIANTGQVLTSALMSPGDTWAFTGGTP